MGTQVSEGVGTPSPFPLPRLLQLALTFGLWFCPGPTPEPQEGTGPLRAVASREAAAGDSSECVFSLHGCRPSLCLLAPQSRGSSHVARGRGCPRLIARFSCRFLWGTAGLLASQPWSNGPCPHRLAPGPKGSPHAFSPPQLPPMVWPCIPDLGLPWQPRAGTVPWHREGGAGCQSLGEPDPGLCHPG